MSETFIETITSLFVTAGEEQNPEAWADEEMETAEFATPNDEEELNFD